MTPAPSSTITALGVGAVAVLTIGVDDVAGTDPTEPTQHGTETSRRHRRVRAADGLHDARRRHRPPDRRRARHVGRRQHRTGRRRGHSGSADRGRHRRRGWRGRPSTEPGVLYSRLSIVTDDGDVVPGPLRAALGVRRATRSCRTTTGRSSANGGGTPNAVRPARASSTSSSPARRARSPRWLSSSSSLPRRARCSTPCCSRSTSRRRRRGRRQPPVRTTTSTSTSTSTTTTAAPQVRRRRLTPETRNLVEQHRAAVRPMCRLSWSEFDTIGSLNNDGSYRPTIVAAPGLGEFNERLRRSWSSCLGPPSAGSMSATMLANAAKPDDCVDRRASSVRQRRVHRPERVVGWVRRGHDGRRCSSSPDRQTAIVRSSTPRSRTRPGRAQPR